MPNEITYPVRRYAATIWITRQCLQYSALSESQLITTMSEDALASLTPPLIRVGDVTYSRISENDAAVAYRAIARTIERPEQVRNRRSFRLSDDSESGVYFTGEPTPEL